MALPTSCPQLPDGGKRDVCTQPAYGSVLLYISTDEAQTFTQVQSAATGRFLVQALPVALDLPVLLFSIKSYLRLTCC